MAEHADERLVRDALEDYRAAVLPGIEPPGVTATRETARYQRRRRITTAAVAATMALVAGGATTYAASRPHSHHPVPAASHAPTPSPTRSDGSQPSPTGSPSTSSSSAPDGRISLAELDNTTLDIPGWTATSDCAPGRYKFRSGVATGQGYSIYLPGNGSISLPNPAYLDVDGDNAQETIVTIACGTQDMNDEVVAFDRDDHGDIVTLGAVAQIDWDAQPQMRLNGVREGADGTIEVRWTQLNQKYPVSQWREYRWTGSDFIQTGGPTTVPRLPSVSSTITSHMTATSTGYQGTLTVEITNDASSLNTIGPVNLGFTLPSTVTAAGTGRCDAGKEWASCQSPDLKPGETWTAVLQLTSDQAHQDTDQTVHGSVQLIDHTSRIVDDYKTKSFTITLPAAQ